MPILESLATVVATGGVKSIFEGIGSFAKDIRAAITGNEVIDKTKLAELEQKAMEIEFAAMKAQTDINIEEAKNSSVFVSGWRPMVGWVCAAGLAYNFVINPIITWGFKILEPGIVPPTLNFTELASILVPILGLGAYRTYEKTKDVVGTH